ncbi:bifunctional diguanylate cyclase/phosphodiesterase [Rhodoferax saidenbachensis]|nr:EAL domain-containing protein [Rhodoferax saidenbachensis]
MLANRNRMVAGTVGLVGIFLLALTLAAAALLWTTRQTALADSEEQEVRFVSGAVAALNRSLLGVDVLLASMDSLLGLSGLVQEWIDEDNASRLIRGVTEQSLIVRYVALVDPNGRVVASSHASGSGLQVNLPDGFLSETMSQPVSTLTISAPVVSFASSERVLYLARYIKMADASKMLAVAQVEIPVLTSIVIQGVDISGLEVTLERADGQLLASVPNQERLLGTRLPPFTGIHQGATQATRMATRLTGAPGIVVTRPVLYQDMLISASIPEAAALDEWRTQRDFIISVSLVFTAMILAAAGFAIWYMQRLQHARLGIAHSKNTLDQALESMVSGFVLLNAEHQLVSWNQRFLEFYPWLASCVQPLLPFEAVLNASAMDQFPQLDEEQRRQWIQRHMTQLLNAQGTHEQALPSGKAIQITVRRTPEGGRVIVYQDVTVLREAMVEIEKLAFYDALTHLPNRRLLMDRLEHATASNARSGRYGALLFLDLDHFKVLNDSLGHDIGDLLLQQVAQRLKTCMRAEDTVARLGGDEFVVMLEDLSSRSVEAAAMARHIGEKILEALNQPYQLAAHKYHSTPSVGVTLFGATALSSADLLKQADIAMYEVKAHGRNDLCFFDPQMQATINARAQLERDLHAALKNNEFELYYQPQYTLQGQVVGAEVLIRWHHPERGMVSPIEFISVAEESELIMHIGQWVLRTACEQLAAWRTQPAASALQLSVNLSARQLQQREIVAQVLSILEETGAPTHLLKLELTESTVLVNVDESIAKMGQLKAQGVHFSVDDFGTGHSSLAYLTQLPLDQLKIDQSFVRNIGLKPTDGVIVQTIIGMARNLGLEVIAEGVETQLQQEFLAEHGCTLYQGYLFCKPVPLTAFTTLLAQTQQPDAITQ